MKFKSRQLPKPHVREVVGKCPSCGGDVYVSATEYYCRNWSREDGCSFRFRKQKLSREISKEEMRQLLDNKIIDLFNLTSKDGNDYDAAIALCHDATYGWGVTFVNRGFFAIPPKPTCESN